MKAISFYILGLQREAVVNPTSDEDLPKYIQEIRSLLDTNYLNRHEVSEALTGSMNSRPIFLYAYFGGYPWTEYYTVVMSFLSCPKNSPHGALKSYNVLVKCSDTGHALSSLLLATMNHESKDYEYTKTHYELAHRQGSWLALAQLQALMVIQNKEGVADVIQEANKHWGRFMANILTEKV